jgi:16S rRNA (cytidine1402-2'-O)-methyltransferase
MLYLVSTPIGNLEDISLRALRILKECDYILCEDTRHSHVLLNQYQINTPLRSFHQFNEKQNEEKIIHDLKEGRSIALISDAGTPGICDPGEDLIKRCYIEQIPVSSIPGPCAWAIALSLSPFDKERVQFLGFMPKKYEERKQVLSHALSYQGTTIFYESPQRLINSLKDIPINRSVCVMRELTKLHEEIKIGSSQELVIYFTTHPPKGECVILIETSSFNYTDLSVEEHVQYLVDLFHLSLSNAIKIVADIRGVPKREIYHILHR